MQGWREGWKEAHASSIEGATWGDGGSVSGEARGGEEGKARRGSEGDDGGDDGEGVRESSEGIEGEEVTCEGKEEGLGDARGADGLCQVD